MGKPTSTSADRSPSRVTSEAVDQRAVLAELSASWDALAVASSRPYSAPGWMLPWWDNVRPEGSGLRAVTVHAGSELIGLAPLCLTKDRWGVVTGNLLGHDTSSYSEPLAREGREREVAAAVASLISDRAAPLDVLSLTGIPHDSPWPRLLQETWPGPRPRLALVSSMQAPFVDIPPGGFDAWFAGRSRNFRQQARSRTREFLRRGGSFVWADSPAKMHDGLRDLNRLHLGRWSDRGGSQAIVPGVMPMLMQASSELSSQRMQVCTAEVDGEAVAAALFMTAGREMHFWLGGFDESWASLSLSVLLLVEAVRDAAATGCHRLSLGPGPQPYKYRLATGEERLDWIDLVPLTRRSPYVTVVQAPRRSYRLAARRTPPAVKDRLRATGRRLLPHGRRGTVQNEQDVSSLPGGET
jgi:CelD/BcsL family acetyltransferase involved in cellulose biosynthesis